MKWSLSASVLALALALLAAMGHRQSPEILHRLSAPYLEDDGSGRTLAHIAAMLRRRDDGVHLEIDIDSVHPSVDPVPGFAGIAGGNRRTAYEMDELVRTGALAVVTSDASGRSIAGSCRSARRGAVPERRLREDGSLAVNALSPERLVLALKVDSGPLAPGRYETNLLVGGTSRLRVTFLCERDGGRLLDVTSLPEFSAAPHRMLP
jgi:hypothetical protein